jgi:quercetin dioxygenase-like cupin family protein
MTRRPLLFGQQADSFPVPPGSRLPDMRHAVQAGDNWLFGPFDVTALPARHGQKGQVVPRNKWDKHGLRHFQAWDKAMKSKLRTRFLGLLLTALILGASSTLAQNAEQVKPVFEHALPNIPGKSMIAVVVTYAPGGKSPAHHHAPSAFIYAHVLSGAIRSQVDDQPAKVYQVGEGFYEVPGSHHRISENASDQQPASLLAVFVVDAKDKALTTPDQKQGSR